MSDLTVSTPPGPPLRAFRPRWPNRRPRLRGLMVRAHRWGSFTLGLLLLVIVVSGAVLLLAPEIEQVTRPSLYDTAAGPARSALAKRWRPSIASCRSSRPPAPRSSRTAAPGRC